MILFKLTGLLVGLALIVTSVFWKEDPDACSYILFVGGIMVLVGNTKQAVNKEGSE